ncbi:MAG: hypothetical protein LC745_10805, partial [Planctomycetia bacterium]|nr:hypothetical protein [Planctomycetia bacterium]
MPHRHHWFRRLTSKLVAPAVRAGLRTRTLRAFTSKLEGLERRRLMTLRAVTWTGAVNHDWDTAGNWSDANSVALISPPLPTDAVTIGANTYTIFHSDANASDTVGSLTTGTPIEIDAGTNLTVTGALDAQALLTVNGGALTANSTLNESSAGGLVVNSGSLVVNGTLNDSSTTTVRGGTLVVNGTLNDAASTSVNGGSLVVNGPLNGTSALNVNSQGTLDVNGVLDETGSLNLQGGTLAHAEVSARTNIDARAGGLD